MNRLPIGFGLAALLMFSALACAADKVPPGKYSLSVARVYESSPARPEWVFILGGTGSQRGGETVCKSLSSLKKLFAGLPRGSTLDWSPTCDPEESKALQAALGELKTICRNAGVTFTIHPSG